MTCSKQAISLIDLMMSEWMGSDGQPCNRLTRGLLQRSHIIADRHRYIGKEVSRRWEQGDDISMADFRCAEYKSGKTVADLELRKQIAKIGIRKTARATKTDTKTVMLISRAERVKARTLSRLLSSFVSRQCPNGRAIHRKSENRLMPYKDPERKRQWEREHREQRNARRREPYPSSTIESSDAPNPNLYDEQSDIRVNMTAALTVALASVVILLLVAWRLRRAREVAGFAQRLVTQEGQ